MALIKLATGNGDGCSHGYGLANTGDGYCCNGDDGNDHGYGSGSGNGYDNGDGEGDGSGDSYGWSTNTLLCAVDQEFQTFVLNEVVRAEILACLS